jgi:hypothetical protein
VFLLSNGSKLAFFFFFFSVLKGLVFIGKNIVRFSNLVHQLLAFCKFDFS